MSWKTLLALPYNTEPFVFLFGYEKYVSITSGLLLVKRGNNFGRAGEFTVIKMFTEIKLRKCIIYYRENMAIVINIPNIMI